HGIDGTSTPKSLETAFQLMYLYFVEPRFDADEYMTGIRQIEAILPNLANNPQFKFRNAMNKTLYGNNERVVELNEETLAKASLAGIEKVYRNILFKDAAGAVLTVIGNVDIDALRPLVEKYAGSLPKGKKASEINYDNVISFVKGQVDENVKVAMQTPKSSVLQMYSAYLPVDVKTQVTLEAANYVLDMIYTKTIREQEGGTYGVSAAMGAQKEPESRVAVQAYFDTNPESAEHLGGLAVKYFKELAENAPTEEELT
ncbi:MAG: insulinase family protein, partial [Bacteroidales bacterium]|nr:insulinase family protein [Bacteroidales bacterium]